MPASGPRSHYAGSVLGRPALETPRVLPSPGARDRESWGNYRTSHTGLRSNGMDANVLLHVREHPEGRVIVTPVDFPDLSVDGDDYGAALRAVRSRVAQRLRAISGSVRNMLAAPV